MSEFVQNFHFLRPILLIFILLPILMLIFKKRAYAQESTWGDVCDKNLLKYLLIKGSSRTRRSLFWIIWTGLLSAIISAAGPSWKKQDMPAVYEQNPVLFVLDLSSDMEQNDIKPNKLSRAKFVLADILKQIPQAQTGLIVYTSEPFSVSPLSEDYSIIENLLPAIDTNIMPANGNRIDRAINFAADKLKNAGFSSGNIIIITSDFGSNAANAANSAQKAAESGYNTSVIHIDNTANDLLKKIADNGKGVYLNLKNNPENIAEFINKKHSDNLSPSKNKTSVWLDYGYYLLFLPILCCLYMFRRGVLFVFILSAFPLYPSYAGFFKNNNQEGLAEFERKNYELAAEKFTDANWQASALYKAGKYQEALQKFSQDNSETGLYNQGNALAKSGKIEDAIKKYEQVLEINPNNEDAKFNLEYLKQKQQEEQQSSDNNSEQNNSDEQNSQSSNGANGQQDNSQEEPQNSDNNDNQQNQDSGSQNSEQNNNASSNNESEQQKNNESSGNNGEQDENKTDKQQEKNDNEGNSENNDDIANAAPSTLQNGEETTTSTEEAMAKAQQYRKIEADPGGLLRAFIRAEYEKNRYKD